LLTDKQTNNYENKILGGGNNLGRYAMKRRITRNQSMPRKSSLSGVIQDLA